MMLYQLPSVCTVEADTGVSEEWGLGREEVFLPILR
jgi:hypothetical protein